MDFQELQRRYDELREQFDAGEISEQEFQGEIEGLQLKDEQGRYWTIGARSGEWYRYDGRQWVQETPIPMTKHQGRGIPEPVSPHAVEREARSSIVPGWLYTGCSGLVLLGVIAALIIGAATVLRGRGVAIGQNATPTLSSGVQANTPTLAPTPSPTLTVPPTDTPLSLRLYSNSAFGFSLQYPANWQVKESRQQVVLAPDDDGISTSIISDTAIIGTSFVVGHQTDSITENASGLLAQFIASLPTDASAIETGFRTVGQTEWAISQVKLEASDPTQEMIAYVAATSDYGTAYTVLAAAPSAEWNDFAPIFQQMFDSFQLTESRAAVAPTPTLTKTVASTGDATAIATDSATSTPEATPKPVIYVVEEGDTLGAIALRFGVTVEAIQAANGVDDPTKLQVGQELIIPGSGSAPSGAGAATATPTAGGAGAGTATPISTTATTPTTAPTPTPAQVALGGKIVFPVFDPNKSIQGQPGGYDIWMSDPQGNNREVLVSNASQPHLSPGGDLLAYRSWDPSGRGVAFLTIGGGRGGLLTSFLEDGLPSWAPDSVTMAFASRREGDRISRLYRVNQANSAEHSLGLIGEYVNTFPDGRLVFKGCTVEGACGMFISGPEGGPLTALTTNTSDTAPAPSPDGAKVAFMSFEREGAGNWEIYIINSGGGDVARLTSNGANDGLPTWSPDGNTIAFVSDRDGTWAIWAMNPDGSNQRKLFNMGGSPDGLVGFDVNNSKGWLEERITWGG
jgi:LysM repeat protein